MRRFLLTLVLVAASCSPFEDAIEIGAVYPSSADDADARDERAGALLAADYVNATGGVDGRPVRIRTIDVATPDAVPAAVDRLADTGVPVVLGSYWSTFSAPAANAAARRGVVFWETGAVGELGMDAALGDHTFRFPASGRVLGAEAVRFVREQLDVADRSYAVAYVDDAYGRSVGLGAVDEIEALGARVDAFAYHLGDDYEALASDIAGARADVLVVAAYLDDAVALRRALIERGTTFEASIGTSSSYCMPAFGALLGDDAVGLFASDKPDAGVIDPDRLTPEGAQAARWFRETIGDRHEGEVSAAALSGFSGALALLRHVLPGAADQTPLAIAEAASVVDLPRGSFPNGSGLRFEGGENVEGAHVIWEWVARERREVVWPPELATHDIVQPVPT